ncbi:hypothetical protein HDU87_004183 [Geranomyces variabilis]|uniref:USP domain-containing protein n=1 Tax=Geranomyces variabilis TaxID=109894 RepID=A0AAD5XQ55_9FUNG|nr:hypothetical protein HDU87_004183 [Geranomyces variabilis]
MASLSVPQVAVPEGKAAKDVVSLPTGGFYIPEVIVYPPAEEDYSEPCISYAPNDVLLGLPNPTRSKPRSALNALLQLFISLPLLNEELPAASKFPIVAKFVKMMRALHVDVFDVPEDKPQVAPESIVEMDWWVEAARLPRDDDAIGKDILVDDLNRAINALHEGVFIKTRFGQRFKIGLVEMQQAQAAARPPLAASSDTEQSSSPPPPSPPQPPVYDTNHLLTISLAPYADTETVTLVTLLNARLGHTVATFFFGGGHRRRSILQSIYPTPPAGSSESDSSAVTSRSVTSSPFATTQPTPKRQIKFSKLPHFLTIHLDRPIDFSRSIYHNVTVEMPLEIDMGFYLENRNSDQKTFYRLHGFVTQIEGHYLTYTRLRGAARWFKCDDEKVTEVNLGSRVESRGVVLVVYRLQER